MRFLTIFFLLFLYHSTSAMSLLQTRHCDTILFNNGRVFYAYLLDTTGGNIRYWDYGESFDKALKVYRLKRIDSIKKGKVSTGENELSIGKQDRSSKKQVDWEQVMSAWGIICSYSAFFVLLTTLIYGSLLLYLLFLPLALCGLLFAFICFFGSKDDPTKFKVFRRSKSSFYPFIFFGLVIGYFINKFIFFY